MLDMFSSFLIMSSDEDQPIVQDLEVGFDSRINLTVGIYQTDYEEPECNCSSWITVKQSDARRMARRHKVKYEDLPHFIGECMKEWAYIINPSFTQIGDCFKEIMESLLDEGCRFGGHHKYGKYGVKAYR